MIPFKARSERAISIDLDGQKSENYAGFSDSQRDSLSVISDLTIPSKTESGKDEEEGSTTKTENKKLSIVLSKDMHRRAKLQALKEDVTLKHLVLSLLERHLDDQQVH